MTEITACTTEKALPWNANAKSALLIPHLTAYNATSGKLQAPSTTTESVVQPVALSFSHSFREKLSPAVVIQKTYSHDDLAATPDDDNEALKRRFVVSRRKVSRPISCAKAIVPMLTTEIAISPPEKRRQVATSQTTFEEHSEFFMHPNLFPTLVTEAAVRWAPRRRKSNTDTVAASSISITVGVHA